MNRTLHTGAGTGTGADTDPRDGTGGSDGAAEADVAVVGAGPTGLLLAGDLAAAGLRVALVERRPADTGNLTRAFGVHARTLEVLDARGVADELLETGSRLTRLRLFGRARLDFSGLRSRFPYLLVTPQYEVERVLRRRAAEAGVEFRFETALRGLRQDAEGVTARLDTPGGGTTTLRARYLVGTDGLRSTVRELLGLPFPGGAVIRSMVLADVRFTRRPDDLVAVDAADGAFAFVAPFGDGWYRVMGWDRDHEVPDTEPVGLEEVRGIVRRAHGTDYGMHDPRWVSRFHSDERQTPAYRSGRVFLAGDAAHVHSPAGGQGMNTGLQDAANLSWKLAAVLHGHAPDAEALLDSYHAERHPVGKAVLRSSGGILRLAMADTPARRALRAAVTGLLGAARPVSDKIVGQISGVGIRYHATRGSHRLTGRRAPDLALEEGRLYELLRQGTFVLVRPRGSAAATTRSAPASAVAGNVVHATWARPDRSTTLLVRPDGYIAWAAD
ncbi:FAD-dependent oxidoreductase [Streptomyces sp. CC53]|uniref:FAD-dependent oxidoreductase n=1 Tax=unclassified Streptomyces TaxID=2593676 RepID=UPI0008DDA285|nr:MULTISPECIES: FAD-dependent oxidoreductase [unclassified Streptomyces]OII66177.1 FAD-dependent oxidoreductase [Streptomyces sp. CC53]